MDIRTEEIVSLNKLGLLDTAKYDRIILKGVDPLRACRNSLILSEQAKPWFSRRGINNLVRLLDKSDLL